MIEACYPLSSMQQGMLWNSIPSQQSGYYIEQVVAHLQEAVRWPVLLQCWQAVIERESVLRTSFHLDSSNQFQQVVHQQVKIPVFQYDLRGLSRVEKTKKLDRFLPNDRAQGFDIAVPPLMRLTLFQLDEAEYQMVWTFHHALLDGRSIAIVLQDVFALYDRYPGGQNDIQPQRRRYQDYIEWSQQQSFANTEPFWRDTLQEFTTPIQFSAITRDQLQDSVDDNLSELREPGAIAVSMLGKSILPSYGLLETQLSSTLATTLENFVQTHGLTLNTLIQGAWAILLSRYGNTLDIIFGATRACRYSAVDKMESMVGVFINTLPVRIRLNPEMKLMPWLKTIREQWLTLRTYEQTPLVDIQQWSEVPGGQPLFNSLLVFDHADLTSQICGQKEKWKHREFTLLEQPHYPLTLNVCGGAALTLKIQFQRQEFPETAVTRMLAYLETLLQSFVANPEQKILELPLLTVAEQLQLSSDLLIEANLQTTPIPFSCFVVGDGVLPLSCLEILLQQECRILGVYSTDRSLQEWAETRGISHVSSRSEFHQQLLEHEYDYLFSINNVQWIIPTDVLSQARKATINYHDSPLPKYAGLYATSWALIHGETQHAVTWHEVTPEIDAGRIFKQRSVLIFAEDTVFNLNTRCFDTAVSSFSELVQDLMTAQVKPQLQELSQRSYFGLSDRPAAAAVLSFDGSSKDICNLVRALDFGPIRNQLGVPKLWLPGGVVAVGAAQSLVMSQSTPGQVLSLYHDCIRIATGDGAVQLDQLTTLDGKPLTEEQLTETYGVKVGKILPVLAPEIRAAISQRNAEICRHELNWAKRLGQIAPFQHPYVGVDAPASVLDGQVSRHKIELPNESIITTQLLLAMFAAYCARLSPEQAFDLGLQTDAQRSIAPEIFAQQVPIRVQSVTHDTFRQFEVRFVTALEEVSRLGSFRYSLLRRYPELQEYRQLNAPMSVVLVQAASPHKLDWRSLRGAIALITYEDGSLPEIVHAGALDTIHCRALAEQLQHFIRSCLDTPDQPLHTLAFLSEQQQRQLLVDWNQTATSYPQDLCIHQLFEQQVIQTPDAIAIAFSDRQLTYQELNAQANQLAHYLQAHGVGPDVLVGLHLERSLEMMVGLLGIHKAGGAYVPLDPDFPQDRLAFMLADSQAPVVITQQKRVANLAVESTVQVIALDSQWSDIAQQPTTNPDSSVHPDHLSYVIYTSGSTGRPKGVMVEHRNVVNFFAGMDQTLDHEPPGVWLAVTSLSFDISVLELFWTLARGFKVVIYNAKQERSAIAAKPISLQHLEKNIDFSLFYFSSDEAATHTAKYRLLLEGAQFADAHQFKAVWTPERHFHAFGGLFPNPAVTSAAIAAVTQHIQIRAGSCVSPLHPSIRIAEDWAVVDNLSGGRVGISFAAGWQPNDFVLRPETFQNRKEIMFQQIEEVQALWRGDSVTYPDGKGNAVAIQTLPRPIQPELPVWVTAASNPETFREAGAKGFHLLTHLLGQSLSELAEKVAIYRQAWRDNGHPGVGTVTLMLHTFVGESDTAVKEIVRRPMRQYLASSLDLIQKAAWSFPTFKQQTTTEEGQFSLSHLSPEAMDEVLDFSFERYFETSGLFGTVDTCLKMVDRVKGIDVDEIACLIDYGVDAEAILAQLPLLQQVKVQSNLQSPPKTEPQSPDSIAKLIQHHQVTHFQCTPSMASLLLADATTRSALSQIRTMMIGGEAFTEALAAQLRQVIPGQIYNMYGPTETTIWSTTHPLREADGIVPIGRPIANTEVYILDQHRNPVPVGVAGELLIGGRGVTRGYLNRPELTAERFVPNPFNANPAERLYRTGDMVRYRMDGTLEFLGRIDFQVKVRGYRIELGEVETLLSRHASVREAVVVVREDIPGDKRLVAYLLPEVGFQPTSTTLRDFLLQQLPEYMAPSHFVTLDAFPLTPNQKVDRKALPAPTMDAPESNHAILPNQQQNSIEQQVLEIWQKVLQISVLGLEDNFFELGGNSLMAVSLMVEMRSIFNVDLPLIDLFQYPTVAGLTHRLMELIG
jgi:natural product biosynthesis luciferase-like monooxygenase protein